LKFKIDENLPVECAHLLRESGFITDTVDEERLSGSNDSILLEFSRSEARVLVTLDLDFADLRLYPPGSHSGIVVIRSKQQDKTTLISLLRRLLPVLHNRSAQGQLWIVEEDRIRYREV
jgi:predicted nuclease of predicted toxin-antitoxin system